MTLQQVIHHINRRFGAKVKVSEWRKSKHDLSEVEARILPDLQSGKGVSGARSPLLKHVMEAGLDIGMESHLCDVAPGRNCRRGISKKPVKALSGSVALEVPRDLNAELEL